MTTCDHGERVNCTLCPPIRKPVPAAPGSLIRRRTRDGYLYRTLKKNGRWKAFGNLPSITITGNNIHEYEVLFDADPGQPS